MNVVIDENLPPGWVAYLARHGIRAAHWRDIGQIGDSDDTVFDHACARQAVILTQDLDFTRILARRGARLPSIVRLRVACPIPKVIGPAVVATLQHQAPQLEAGCLISLDAASHRIRLLPLR